MIPWDKKTLKKNNMEGQWLLCWNLCATTGCSAARSSCVYVCEPVFILYRNLLQFQVFFVIFSCSLKRKPNQDTRDFPVSEMFNVCSCLEKLQLIFSEQNTNKKSHKAIRRIKCIPGGFVFQITTNLLPLTSKGCFPLYKYIYINIFKTYILYKNLLRLYMHLLKYLLGLYLV